MLDYTLLAHVSSSARLVVSGNWWLYVYEHTVGFSSLAILTGHWETGSETGLAGSIGYVAHGGIWLCGPGQIITTLTVKVEFEREWWAGPKQSITCLWVVSKENTQSFPRERTRASPKGDGFKTWLMGLYRTFDIFGCLAPDHSSHFGGLPNQMRGRAHKL